MRYCKHESSPCATICWGLTSLSRFGMRCLQIHICKLPTKSPTPSPQPFVFGPLPKWQNIQRELDWIGLEAVHCTLYTLYSILYILYTANCQQNMDRTNNKTNTKKPPLHSLFWISFFFSILTFISSHFIWATRNAHTQTTIKHYKIIIPFFTLDHFLNSDNTFPGDTTITTINHET